MRPEITSLTRQQQQQLQRPLSTLRRKQSLDGGCGSQLLRRLVSQTPGITTSRTYDDAGGTSSPSSLSSLSPNGEISGLRRDATERVHAFDGIIDSFAESEGDRGGGGGGGGCRNDGQSDRNGSLDNIDTNRRNPSCAVGSSVLMNLLVSGCDVSAGYVCLVKPKPAKGIASA